MLRSVRSLAAASLAALSFALLPASYGSAPAGTAGMATPPLRPEHTVVVVLENHSYDEIIGNPQAPYINSLRAAGASFTDSHGVGHPSEPNYLALFAGTTEGLSDDSCPHTYSDPNLATSLAAAGLSFAGFSEGMPSNGYAGCSSDGYARKHNPWVNFVDVPATSNLTFDAFPTDFALLPTVAFVVPNLCNDMHDCGVATGDAWLATHLDGYVRWAMENDSLFVLTFDESDSATNRVTTIFLGPMVIPGDRGETIDHYATLRALEELYGVALTGRAAQAAEMPDVWLEPTPTPTPTPVPPAERLPLVLPERRGEPVYLPPWTAPPTPTTTPASPALAFGSPDRHGGAAGAAPSGDCAVASPR